MVDEKGFQLDLSWKLQKGNFPLSVQGEPIVLESAGSDEVTQIRVSLFARQCSQRLSSLG